VGKRQASPGWFNVRLKRGWGKRFGPTATFAVLLRRPGFAQPLFIDSATSMMSRRSDFAKRIISAVPFAARKSHEQMRLPLGDYLLVAPLHRELSVLCPIRWKSDG
jgi:hypothetical protein